MEILKPDAPLSEKTLEEAAAQFITPEVPNVEAVLKAAKGSQDSEFRVYRVKRARVQQK